MGWRGTIRTLNAIARESERNARRRQRALERSQKDSYRMAEAQRAENLIEDYNDKLEQITGVHKECGERVNWQKIAYADAPEKPVYDDILKQKALYSWQNYKPGIFDRIFKRVEKKREKLFRNIDLSEQEDKSNYNKLRKKFESDNLEWQEETELARGVLLRDPKSYLRAIKELGMFTDIGALGSNIELKVLDNGTIEATLYGHSQDIIPKESFSLLKSGKLSTKAITKAQSYLLFQSYVCGCVLRVANELFAALPAETVIVTAKSKLLNVASGHLEERPIVSALIPRDTLEGLNMDLLEPSDSMKNFVHHMDFKKSVGFNPVEEISGEAQAKIA